MVSGEVKIGVFIDYDNLPLQHKRAGVLDVVTKALIQLPMEASISRAMCDVRIYGGWYEGTGITAVAQSVAVEIQQAFPTIIRLPTKGGNNVSISTNAELAVSLLQEPGHHLFNTYRRKGKPANVRVEDPISLGCSDSACVLPLMKKLLRNGSCPKPGCTISSTNLIYRNEQKIVDTMLSCDLIHAAATGYAPVLLVSGDDDFLPPLRTILLRGTSAFRFHPTPTYQKASFPHGGVQLIERNI